MGIRVKIADWLLEGRALDTMDPLLSLIIKQEPITREQAMNIPAFAGCIRFISETVAGLPVKLYREEDNKAVEVLGDPRVALLNDDTQDILSGWDFKRALVEDALIDGGGYAYIERERNRVKSLHYVARQYISFLIGTDPIYKSGRILVNGQEYRDFEFIRVLRSTKDGIRGAGILQESPLPLAVSYNMLRYENTLVKTGGNSRGFLKAEKKIEKNAFDELKKEWKKHYEMDNFGAIVLNAGVDFKQTSASSVELQLNERKKALFGEICALCGVAEPVIGGNPTEDDMAMSIKEGVMPVLPLMEGAFDRDLLLESEKPNYYFRFDTKELLRASIEKRYAAYKAAIDANVLQIDEARYMEDLPPLDLAFIKLGLQDVLYDPKTREFFVPNMNQTGTFEATGGANTGKGGETDDED